MTTLSDAAEILSPPEVAQAGGKFSEVLGALRKIYLGKRYKIAIEDIRKAFNCSERTAQRIYAGQSVSGDTVIAGLVSEKFGGPMVEEALRRVPIERRANVAKALRDSADLILSEILYEAAKAKMRR